MTLPRHTVVRRLLPGCAAVVLVGLVLSGCGGSSKASGAAGAAGTDGRAAQAFPATTVAFLDANIDGQSDAWKRLLALGAHFPSFPKLVTKFDTAANRASGDGPTVQQVRSWLGSEVAAGVLAVPADGSDPPVLGFAEVRDRGSLEAQIKKDKETVADGTHGGFDVFKESGGKAVIAISDDTALVGNSEAVVDASIDRLAGTGDKLSDSSDFKDTLASLPSDNLVVGYAPGSALQQLVAYGKRKSAAQSQTLQGTQLDKITASLKGIRGLGYSMDATDSGLRMRTTALLDGTSSNTGEPYTPALLGNVPASSWFAASFGGVGGKATASAEQSIAANPALQSAVSQLELRLGVKLDDLYALFSGENALYAGPGAPLSAGLLMHPADAARGATTLRAITRFLATQGIPFSDTADGQSAVIKGFTARWRSVGGNLAIGTDAAVGDAVKDSLVDSDTFKRVLGEDGIDSGSKTLGLAYLDVPSLVGVATAFGAFNGAGNQEALDNLKHVGGVLFWAGRDGDTVTSDLFVEST
jgi:hypothetical protein